MTPREAESVRVVAEAYERWEKMPPLGFTIGRMEMFILLNACQTMITHPHIPDGYSAALEHLGRQLQERLCDTPEIYNVCELGWHRQFDVRPQKG